MDHFGGGKSRNNRPGRTSNLELPGEERLSGEENTDPGPISIPSISLSNGGGAIKGIDEKFTVNPATGTGSLNVPIFISAGRSNFQPQLSLSYNSGTGNGPFGMGWDLSVPSITRKTDKGIPRYRDLEESDTFILSGAEDLVPVLEKNEGEWERKIAEQRELDGKYYDILFFRPRIEGLFARIERWTNKIDKKDVFWRAITRDNITSIYGRSDTARISKSSDDTGIFKWLLERTFDDKGNIISYEYKQEDARRVVTDTTEVHKSWIHEKNRLAKNVHESQRYLKRIRYGNKTPYYIGNVLPNEDDYLFEVVFDYGDHTYTEVDVDVGGQASTRIQCSHADDIAWPCRPDPYSSYRSSFEIRTYRLCRRVLMFHHFRELGDTPCLVRSTDFTYAENPVATKLIAATQTGYKRNTDDTPYLFKSFPPVEFGYAELSIDQQIREVPEESLENFPVGLDNDEYQWIDLDGEGISGILTEQGGGWFYKPNLGNGEFGPMRAVISQPSHSNLADGNNRFLDLAGDGQLDLVLLEDQISGFFERTDEFEWKTFKPFQSKPNINWLDPNLRFIDLNGDGHADILITEDELFVWYPSLEEAGFDEANSVPKVLDEEEGPTVVFSDASESIYLSDMSGDGLTDIVRIRNGEVCYWPNLGYGRFGSKVTMASPPFFDRQDKFDPKRLRLGDIDGTGTSDIFYLDSQAIRFWYNRSGNSWSDPETLTTIPRIDNYSAISVVDLLGNGTSCLVWSSPLPGNSNRPMRYIDLMGSRKPHLLVRTKNNLGAETKITYSSSTKFYIEDKKSGNPWITGLSFPVHVVEKVETYDYISGNRFVTCYAYHHGYYDGIEREFRGFGRVDQWDTERFAVLSAGNAFPTGDNIDVSSHVPPVLTKTWFHTGAYVKGAQISRQLELEYYQEGDPSLGQPELSLEQHRAMLLDDTLLPETVSIADGSHEPYQLRAEERREACRSLKGSLLRQEIYALDGTEKEKMPYTVSERNYTIELLQSEVGNRNAVFFSHPREIIDYHYERKLYDITGQKFTDPRVSHSITLSVDSYGNVQQAVAIGYGRRFDTPDSLFTDEDREKQKQHLVSYTENQYTNAVLGENAYRLPLQCDAATYELINVVPAANQQNITNLFRFEEIRQMVQAAADGNHEIPYEDVGAGGAVEDHPYRRLIEHVRQLYYADDLAGPLEWRKMDARGLLYETYKLAFTSGLIESVYERDGSPLLTRPVQVLQSEGGYVLSDDYKARNWFPNEDPDGGGWIPSGQQFYSTVAEDPALANPPDPLAQNVGFARQHFYLPQGVRDPFGAIVRLSYDGYNLLLKKTENHLKNIVTVETKDDHGNDIVALDYRVLQPWKVADPNGNSTEARFDVLGMVAGTAVRGKNDKGDLLTDFAEDLNQDEISAFFADPMGQIAKDLLKDATTRIIYDIASYHRLGKVDKPIYAATIVRESHKSELSENGDFNLQVSFSYSDGFGREIQQKIQAEPGPVEGLGDNIDPRWVGSGWTVFNNKDMPVRQYEPFFSTLPDDRHGFEFARKEGVSPILFYDPIGRVVATLLPNHTYEKVVFDAWNQETWDANDTVTLDPSTDADVNGFFLDAQGDKRIPDELYSPTWYEQRINGNKGPDEQMAAQKAAVHANTFTVAHFDSLDRIFITFTNTGDDTYKIRVDFDFEGNQRTIWDRVKLSNGDYIHRKVILYDYDMIGTPIHQISMEAGTRWMLANVAGNPIRRWDSRQQDFRTCYDKLQRPTHRYLNISNNSEKLVERLVYGEQHPDVGRNLRGQLYRHYEQAGVVTNEVFDFKGNLQEVTRTLANDYKNIINWQLIEQDVTSPNHLTDLHTLAASQLNESFTSITRYDALNRPIQIVSPYNAETKPNIVQHQYNAANLLTRVDVWRQLNAVPDEVMDPILADYHVIANMVYNARGQRELIQYGNGVETYYDYDREIFRLTHLYSRRSAAYAEDCGEVPPRFAAPDIPPIGQPCGLQNLHYTYDPAGNITRIQDDAQQSIYFDNQVINSRNEYTYDAHYRLIEATGREHLGLNDDGNIRQPKQIHHSDVSRRGRPLPGDPRAVSRCKEKYQYDIAGNVISVHHIALNNTNGSWWRYYRYEEDSLIEPDLKSNRLSSTSRQGESQNGPYSDTYGYKDDNGVDVNGCITSMPHLFLMQWDYRDQLQATSTQDVVDPECQRETTYYVYDAAGQRIRKVNECYAAAGQNPNRSYERFYLNGFEIYRKYGRNNQEITLQIDTLHIMDDDRRVAIIEMRTIGEEDSPQVLNRYQLTNHLGSACLELNDHAVPISYEEYYPYGSTSYQAKNAQIRSAAKRYRYSGKERDEESGLYYYGVRSLLSG